MCSRTRDKDRARSVTVSQQIAVAYHHLSACFCAKTICFLQDYTFHTAKTTHTHTQAVQCGITYCMCNLTIISGLKDWLALKGQNLFLCARDCITDIQQLRWKCSAGYRSTYCSYSPVKNTFHDLTLEANSVFHEARLVEWKQHLKTHFCVSSACLCLLSKFVWCSETNLRDKKCWKKIYP